jgi:hypothetical protein
MRARRKAIGFLPVCYKLTDVAPECTSVATTPYTVEIGKYQKYGELLKNSVDNYPMREKIIFVMKDMASVKQALAMGAVAKSLEEGQEAINRMARVPIRYE